MIEKLTNYFVHVFDFPFVLQLICYAVTTVLLLGIKVTADGKAEFKPIVFAVETFALVVFFLVVDLLIAMIGAPYMFYFDSTFKYFSGILLFALIRGKHSYRSRLVMGTTAFALCVLMGAMGTLCGQAVEQAVQGFDIAITKIISYVLTVVCAVLFYKYPVFKFETGRFDSAMITVCNSLSALAFVIYEYMRRFDKVFMQASYKQLPFISVIIFILFVIDIVTYFMMYCVCREKARALAYEIERQKKQSLQELLALSESKLSELREVRHDVKNQYAYMQSMLEEGKYDELKSYFNELIGTFALPLFEQVDSGNPDIDSVLNLELAKMRAKDIKANIRVSVPSELPVKKSHLLSLFANVIDNAIDACGRDKPENPLIDVVVNVCGDELVFCVSNPTKLTQEELDRGISTSKEDKSRHGYGMKIIQKIIKKYNGYYRCYIKDGLFIAEGLLGLVAA